MAEDRVHVTIDGAQTEVPKGTILWEAAKDIGVDIPIFCYHSKLGPVGVCRMCMVQVEGMPKLTTACTTTVTDGMVVHTRSPEVEKAQRGVLEFLLINHPLDCPICDRGGECPLQDQTFQYGPGISRFVERKRHFVKPVRLGPTIDLDRERCILCWRCVRFTSEVAEDNKLILVDRGSESFIGTFEAEPYVSNFSGNVIELCPVGALTSHKQRFTFRPWELQQHPSICPHCPMGCNINIDVRDAQEVIRFRSRTNEAVDDGWLCDRGRFGYDFIGSPDRLKTPLIREDGTLRPASFSAAYRLIAERLQRVAAEAGPHSIAGIASPRLSNEDLFVFRRFLRDSVGSESIDYWPRPEYSIDSGDSAALQTLDSALTSIDRIDSAALIVLIAADPSEKEPVMELRIRSALNKRSAQLVDIGIHDVPLSGKASAVLRFAPDQIDGVLRGLFLAAAREAGSEEFAGARELLDGDGPVVLLYDDSFPDIPQERRRDALLSLAYMVDNLRERRQVGVIPLLTTSNEMAARDFGVMAPNDSGSVWGEPLVDRLLSGDYRAALFWGANPVGTVAGLTEAVEALDFVAVSELRLSETAGLADVVLPASCFAEKVGTVTNTCRRVQVFSEAVPAPGMARPDWQMLVELSQRWDNPLSYASPEAILADISGSVPGYAGRLPTSYRRVGPLGVAVKGGGVEAAE